MRDSFISTTSPLLEKLSCLIFLAMMLILLVVITCAQRPTAFGDATSMAASIIPKQLQNRLGQQPAALVNALVITWLSRDRLNPTTLSPFPLSLLQRSMSHLISLLRHRMSAHSTRNKWRKRQIVRLANNSTPPPSLAATKAALNSTAETTPQIVIDDWSPSSLHPPQGRNQPTASPINATRVTPAELFRALLLFTCPLGLGYALRNARNKNAFKEPFDLPDIPERYRRKFFETWYAALTMIHSNSCIGVLSGSSGQAGKRAGARGRQPMHTASSAHPATATMQYIATEKKPTRRAKPPIKASSHNGDVSYRGFHHAVRRHRPIRWSNPSESKTLGPNYRPCAWSADVGNGPYKLVTAMNDLFDSNIFKNLRHGYGIKPAHSNSVRCTGKSLAGNHADETLGMLDYLPAYTQLSPFDMQASLTPHDSNIETQKKLKIERLDSASKFIALAEQMGAMPYLADLDEFGTPFYISKTFAMLMGYDAETWCADRDLRIQQLHPDDRENVLSALRETLSDGGNFSMDYRLFTQEGNIFWVHDEARVIINSDDEPLFIQGILLDISASKHAQQELERSHIELQKLIAALDALREKEQKRLAQEMHDDLGQLLAAMKIDLCTLQQHLPSDQPQVLERLGNLNELVDAMVSSVRRIIADLPPKIMEECGLFHALTMLVSGFEKRHGVVARLELPPDEHMLSDHVATPVYRIVQEALNNVAKHANATCVEVCVVCTDQLLKVGIKDNGRGMTVYDMQKNESFGLISMRERVNALGGEMEHDSIIGDGTSIRILIPLALSEN